MDADRNLLFGVLALQADAITKDQFLQACALWASDKQKSLAEHLLAHGWILPEDRADIDRVVERKLKKHQGDSQAGLLEVTTDGVRELVDQVADPEMKRSLIGIAHTRGNLSTATVQFIPVSGSRYTRTRLHAKGGMGQVWLAHDSSVNRHVALKELRPERAQEEPLQARFIMEAQLTGQLEHPGIVPIYEIGRSADDQPFYTMRFMRGRTLYEALRYYHKRKERHEATAFEFRELITAFASVCKAVAFAHNRQIIHRDLKPQNVVLGDFGEVMVLDWGLAKVLSSDFETLGPESGLVSAPKPQSADSAATTHGQVVGTPAYMSPEQADGLIDQLTLRTDVYGLGAMLYEILAGKSAFDGENTEEVLQKIRHEAPKRPRLLNASLSPALEAVCLKAMSKKPADRYASAKELASEIELWLADEPVEAYAEPWMTRASRFARRHRTLVTVSGALLITIATAAMIGLAVVSGKNVEIAASRAEAQENFRKARDAVDKMLSRVGDDRLRDVPMMEKLRRDLLEEALEFNQEFVRTHGDNPEIRHEAALASVRLGRINQMLRQESKAEECFQEAIAGLSRLAAQFPRQPIYRRDLATAHANLGRTAHAPEKGQKHWSDARDLQQALVTQHPRERDYRFGLADSLLGLAGTDRAMSKQPLAQEKVDESLKFLLELSQSHPNEAQYQQKLADAYHLLAILQEEQGNMAEAGAAFEKCVAAAEQLAKNDSADARFGLASHYRALAVHYARTRRAELANEYFMKSSKAFERLAKEFPFTPDYAHVLATSYSDLAVMRARANELDEAAPYFQKVVDERLRISSMYPNVPDYRRNLAIAFQQLGQVSLDLRRLPEAVKNLTEAQAAKQKLIDDYPNSLEYKFDFAIGESILGMALHAQGDDEAAAPHYVKAIEVAEIVAASSDVRPEFRHKLALNRRQYADYLRDVGKKAEAAEEYQKAMAIWDQLLAASPNAVDFQRQRATAETSLQGLSQTKE